MKQIQIFIIIGSFLVFSVFSCKNTDFFSEYRIELPSLPPIWRETLGEPLWRLEWLGRDGTWHRAEGIGAAFTSVLLPEDQTAPLLAYPFWPDRGIAPGIMRPAGALFPFDAAVGTLRLNWEGGVDAVFYREMAAVQSSVQGGKAKERRAAAFDWPRFRTLLRTDNSGLPAELRRDPWLADWSSLAAKTLESGFDRRRIRPRVLKELSIPIPGDGPWAGSSPFEKFPSWEQGDPAILGASAEVQVLVGGAGMIRYTKDAWVWIPWE